MPSEGNSELPALLASVCVVNGKSYPREEPFIIIQLLLQQCSTSFFLHMDSLSTILKLKTDFLIQ